MISATTLCDIYYIIGTLQGNAAAIACIDSINLNILADSLKQCAEDLTFIAAELARERDNVGTDTRMAC